jgi:hypothetical protein
MRRSTTALPTLVSDPTASERCESDATISGGLIDRNIERRTALCSADC